MAATRLERSGSRWMCGVVTEPRSSNERRFGSDESADRETEGQSEEPPAQRSPRSPTKRDQLPPPRRIATRSSAERRWPTEEQTKGAQRTPV